MGELERKTRLTGGGGRWQAVVPAGWEDASGGVARGLLGALVLRAVGAFLPGSRPLSIACQFLRPAAAGPVEIAVSALHHGERTAALRASLTQSEAPNLEALVWTTANSTPGHAVEFAPIPEFPGPEGLPSVLEATEASGRLAPGRWRHAEFRSDTALRERGRRASGWCAWHRLAPPVVYDDPHLDAGRLLFLLDARAGSRRVEALADEAPAGWRWDLEAFGPALDLSVQLHRDTRESDWLLIQSRVAHASEAAVQSQLRVWAIDGSPLATGAVTLAPGLETPRGEAAACPPASPRAEAPTASRAGVPA